MHADVVAALVASSSNLHETDSGGRARPAGMASANPSWSGRVWTGALGAALLATVGCSNAVRPANPRVPGSTVRFVEKDAPFIVDWEPHQLSDLEGAVRNPARGAVVVRYHGNAIRILQDCFVSGTYVRYGTTKYTGMLQVRSSDQAYLNAGVPVGALQQISTSAGIGQSTLLNYQFVVVGRYDLSGSRPSATLLEIRDGIPNGCTGATHFVRAVQTGAFQRLSDAYGGAGAQVSGPGASAGIVGQSQQTIGASGGDYNQCAASGNPNSPACKAVLRIELAPIFPAQVPLHVAAFTVNGQIAPNLRFLFRGARGYRYETTSFPVSSAQVDLTIPVAEISEDAPLLIDVVQQNSQGPAVVGSGRIAPKDLRMSVTQGYFDIDLQNQAAGGAMGKMRLNFASLPR